MAGGKLTPRQKMINMMYLVLTALLALNVSQEVLNAFHLVNEGLETSNGSLNDKNKSIYDAFAKQMNDNKDKASQFNDRAQKAKVLALALNDTLNSYKEQIVKLAGGIDTAGEGDIVQRDNIDIATKMFVEDGAGVKRGQALQKMINDTRAKLLELIDPADRASFKISLDAQDPKKEKGEVSKWEYKTFNHVPATAAVTILTKFQNDATSSEGAVIEYLIKKIGANDFKFTDLTAKIIAPSSYVLDGQSYKADIFLAAFNKGSNPEIFEGPIGQFKKNSDGDYDAVLSDNPLPAGFSSTPMKAENGFGKKEVMAAGTGEKTYTGVIRVKDPATSKWKFYPFEGKYQTAPKAIVVSPTKMNVLYTGVDNPLDISVPGVGQNDVSASIEGGGGSLKKDPANPASYLATVTALGKCNISVTAKIEGKQQAMGVKEFRVKRIPNPTPMTNTKATGGTIAVGTLKATGAIVAVLQDFDFDAHFTVTSFTFLLSSRGNATKIEGNSGVFTQQMKQALETAKSKDIVIIDDIKAVGPDKVTRKIGQLAFTIQ